ncbi:MAG: class I lanthipeptide [Spirosomataceae bacterium]
MKKTINRINLKTDKIVSLSAKQTQQIVGGVIYYEKAASKNC